MNILIQKTAFALILSALPAMILSMETSEQADAKGDRDQNEKVRNMCLNVVKPARVIMGSRQEMSVSVPPPIVIETRSGTTPIKVKLQ